MDNYKFELIRSDESQQINHSITHKFEALLASELVDAFIDFASGCGFFKESLYSAMQSRIDESTGE